MIQVILSPLDYPWYDPSAWSLPVDISAHIRSLSVTRVRDEMSGRFQAGSMALTVGCNPTDTYVVGGVPYTIDVLLSIVPGIHPVRVLVDGSVAAHMWITSWSFGYSPSVGLHDRVVSITCTDAIGLLSSTNGINVYDWNVLWAANSLKAYYRFDEQVTTPVGSVPPPTTPVLDISGWGNNTTIVPTGVVTPGVNDTPVVDDTGHCVELFDSPTLGSGWVSLPQFVFETFPGTIECWFRFTGSVGSGPNYIENPFQLYYLDNGPRVRFALLPGTGPNQILLECYLDNSTLALSLEGDISSAITGTGWYHIAWTWADDTSASTWRVYLTPPQPVAWATAAVIDVTSLLTITSGAGTAFGTNGAAIGFFGLDTPPATNPNSVRIARWAYYGSALTADELTTHLQHAAGGWGETTDARLVRIWNQLIDMWGTANLASLLAPNLNAGSAACGDCGNMGSSDLLTTARSVEIAEYGAVFSAKSGGLAFRSRTAWSDTGSRTATVQAVIDYRSSSVAVGAALAAYSGITMTNTYDYFVSNVTINVRNYVPFTAALTERLVSAGELTTTSSYSATSAAYPGPDCQYPADQILLARGVNYFSVPIPSNVTIADGPQVITTLELWDRAQVLYRFPGLILGTSTLIDFVLTGLITGISWSWDAKSGLYPVTLNISPFADSHIGSNEPYTAWSVTTWDSYAWT